MRDQAIKLVKEAKELAAKSGHTKDHLIGQAHYLFRRYEHPADEYYFYGAIYHELRWPLLRKIRQGGGAKRVLLDAYRKMVAAWKREERREKRKKASRAGGDNEGEGVDDAEEDV